MAKADKLRDCPAVGRKITGQECGSNRGTRYDCPPGCPHCPWTAGNYDQLLEIGRKFDGKLLDFYGKTMGASAVMQRLQPHDAKRESEEMECMQRCYLEFYQREVRPGKKLFDLWCESGWSGLRNDEIFLAGFAPQTRAAVFEVRRVLDDLRCECTDVLEGSGAMFTVCDRGLAAAARQYQAFCGWLVPSPFFRRLYGVAFPLSLSPESARATALRHIEKLGGPLEGNDEITEWLGENFSLFVESVSGESAKQFERIWRNLDAKQCVASYGFSGTADDLGLVGREDFDETPPTSDEVNARGAHRCFVWLRAGASRGWEKALPEALQGGGIGPGVPMWGQLRVFPGRVEISAMSSMHFEPMKEMLAEFFGERLEFEKEFVADLAKQVGAGERRGHQAESSLPTGLATSPEEADLLRSLIRSNYEKFLREPVPALDGLTPREAAARPKMRGRLVDLMKGHLRSVDDLGRRHGVTHDIGWVLEELGLDELVSAPHSVERGIPLPRNWWRTYDEEEVVAAIEEGGQMDGPTTSGAWPELRRYLDDAVDSVPLQDAERAALLVGVGMVLHVLVPRGAVPPTVGDDELNDELATIYRQLEKDGDVAERVKRMIDSSPQPALLGTVVGVLMREAVASDGAWREIGDVRPGAIAVIAVEIEALIRCLQRAALG